MAAFASEIVAQAAFGDWQTGQQGWFIFGGEGADSPRHYLSCDVDI